MAVQMLSQQIAGLAALTGQTPEALWKSLGTSFEQGIPGDLSTVAEKPKRTYKRVQPDTAAKAHEVGDLAVDPMGRTHRVVMRKAFKGEIKAWKLVPEKELGSGDLEELRQIEMSQVATKMDQSDYQDAATADLICPGSGSDSPSTKRKYTSKKPDTDPKSLSVGTVQEANGIQWVVAEAKTRGEGKRQLWKRVESVSPIAPADDSDSEPEMGSPLELDSEIVQNTPWLTVEDVQEAQAKRKYSSKKPEMSPKGLPVGTTTEANGIQWVVADVKTRGDGKRQLWKRAVSPSSEIEVLSSSETPEPEVEEPTAAKRQYTSRKPVVDPKDLETGTILESNGIRWVVSSAKTRGDGTRKLWKRSDSPSSPEPQMETMAVQMMEVVATPKKVRNSPTESANHYQPGDTQVGNDGRRYQCVERLRKAKADGEEPTAYNAWQLAK